MGIKVDLTITEDDPIKHQHGYISFFGRMCCRIVGSHKWDRLCNRQICRRCSKTEYYQRDTCCKNWCSNEKGLIMSVWLIVVLVCLCLALLGTATKLVWNRYDEIEASDMKDWLQKISNKKSKRKDRGSWEENLYSGLEINSQTWKVLQVNLASGCISRLAIAVTEMNAVTSQ